MANIPSAAPVFKARFVAEVEEYQNALFYGDSGNGKTWLAGSALLVPEMCDILFISIESGEAALREVTRQAKAKGLDPNRMLVVPIETYSQLAQVYKMLTIHIQARDRNDVKTLRKLEAQIRGMDPSLLHDDTVLEGLIPNPLKIKTVITDSLSEAQKFCMYQLLNIDPTTQALDEEPDSATFGEWGKSREMISFFVRRLRDLPVNAIFTCAESTETDAKKFIHYDISLPGKLATDVRQMVDTVGYLYAMTTPDGNVVRRLLLRSGSYGTMTVKAKNRYGSALKGAWVDNPSMEMLFKMGLE